MTAVAELLSYIRGTKTETCDISRIRDHDTLEAVLCENARRFWQPGWLFSYDSNIQPPSKWDTAKLRVFVPFLSTGRTRAASSTDIAVYTAFKELFGDDVWVDFCFLPDEDCTPVLDEVKLPWWFGSTSHRSMWDYDLIILSNAIVDEKMNLIPCLHNSGFPVWHTERIDRDDVPLFIMAGQAAEETVELFAGDSQDGKNRGLIDGMFHGYAEGMIQQIIPYFLERKAELGGDLRKDKRTTIHRMFEKFSFFYYPYAFEYDYKPDNVNITALRKVDPDHRDVVPIWRPSSGTSYGIDDYFGWRRKILHSTGENIRFADVQISRGCSSGGACTFCKEAHVAGRWEQRSKEKLRDDMIQAKAYSLASGVGFFSFNTNYFSDYIDMMYDAATIFGDLSVIGMRADVIAAKPEYFRMNKLIGQRRITFGVEGVSDRIRDGYLNKNLTEQELLLAAKRAFEGRFVELKLYLICTGLETMEDFQEFEAMIKKMIKIRDSMGAKTSIRIPVSTLTYYTGTPLQWEPRRSMQAMLDGRRVFAPLLEMMKPLGVRVKFTSRGKNPLISQFMVDAGRPGTKILEAAAKEGMVKYYSLPREHTDRFIALVEENGIKWSDLLAGRDPNAPFTGQPVVSTEVEYLKRMWEKARNFEGVSYCLATAAKPTDRVCFVCGYCKSIEERIQITKRLTDTNVHSPEEVMVAVSLNKPRHRVRVTLDVQQEYGILNKDALFQFAAATAYRHLGNDAVVDVHSIGHSTQHWAYTGELMDFSFGQFVFDILTRKRPDIERIIAAFKETAGHVMCSKFVRARYMPMQGAQIKYNDWAIHFSVFRDVGVPDLAARIRSWDGTARIQQKSTARKPTFDTINLRDNFGDVPEILMTTVKGKTALCYSLPLQVNPYVFLFHLTHRGYKRMLAGVDNRILGYYRLSEPLCEMKGCGNHRHFDISTGEMPKFCNLCVRRSVVTRLVGK